MAIHVREKPPLRLHIVGETPSGRRFRWAQDEPRAENVFSGLRHSDTMPGGFESMDCVLPRKLTGVDYSDLKRLSTLQALGAGGDIAAECRLERAPRVSGDQMAISPSAVGWQAHLEDDKTARGVYVDGDLNAWGPTSTSRKTTLLATSATHDARVISDQAGSSPALGMSFDLPGAVKQICEAQYDSGAGNEVAEIYREREAINADLNAAWHAHISVADDGDLTNDTPSANLHGTSALADSGYYTPATARRVAILQFYRDDTLSSPGVERLCMWRGVRLYGPHELTKRGPDPGGFYASDVVPHALARWAPMLRFTEGADGSISPTTFVIPQLAFREPTTVGEMVRQALRFGFEDWAVWEHRTFYMHARGARGRSWRARIRPAQLEETGPQVDRLWDSIMVQHRDVDGTTKTVGPPGSGADTESADLEDTDPENPANQLPLTRRDLLVMGIGSASTATAVGREFLEQSKLLDSSGRARLVGWVTDDRGVIHPYWRVRAGDTISFVDAADTSPRRIVKADKDYATRTCSIDIDAPPEGLQALLERLNVVLVPLGVG